MGCTKQGTDAIFCQMTHTVAFLVYPGSPPLLPGVFETPLYEFGV
jgi:hypothetical protein